MSSFRHKVISWLTSQPFVLHDSGGTLFESSLSRPHFNQVCLLLCFPWGSSAPAPPTGSCPSLCRWSPQPANWPPFSLVSLSPSWVLSPELCHRDIKSYTLPQVNTEILNVAPHSITPRDDPVPAVGSLVQRFSPWSTATWPAVEGLGSHSKSCAIWPHPNLELHLVLYLCRHLVFQL